MDSTRRSVLGAALSTLGLALAPAPYPGRAPPVHLAISGPGFEPLITQMYVAGAAENAADFLLNGISDPQARRRLLVPFEKPGGVPGGELLAQFDIVLAADGRLARPTPEHERLQG